MMVENGSSTQFIYQTGNHDNGNLKFKNMLSFMKSTLYLKCCPFHLKDLNDAYKIINFVWLWNWQKKIDYFDANA